MTTVYAYALVGVAGYVGGFMTSVGYYHSKGHRIILPVISKTSRNFTVMVIALALMSLATIVQTEHNAAQSEQCDRQFREALRYNTDIAAQERGLADRERTVNADARTALADWFAAIITLPAGQRDEGIRVTIEYNDRAAEVATKLQDLEHERETLAEARTPYPEPSCGK